MMPEPMTKQEAIETLEIFRNDYIREDSDICRAIDIAIGALRNQTIESEVRHGRWILCKDQYNVDNDNGNYAYYCSCCKHQDVHAESAKVSFCWNCGTQMNTD